MLEALHGIAEGVSHREEREELYSLRGQQNQSSIIQNGR